MKCYNCRKKISENDNYCPFCGQAIDPQKRLNNSLKKGYITSLIMVVVMLAVIFLIVFIDSITDIDLIESPVPLTLAIFIVIIIFVYILSKDSFGKKGKNVRYKIVINSRFNDDFMLQQALIQKLNELGFQKDYNFSGNTYNKRNFINEYISYNIQNGKIYLEAFIKAFNKEVAPHYGFNGIVYKRFFMREISKIVNYFQN